MPLLRPEKTFHQKPTPLPRLRKLAHPPINIAFIDMDDFVKEEKMKNRPL